MCKEIVLDVHALTPPAPFEIAIEQVTHLQCGEYIKMLHRLQPFPLYDILLENGFRYKVLQGEFGFDIYIWLAKDKATGERLKRFV